MTKLADPAHAEKNHLKVIVADCETCAHCIDLHEDNETNPQGLQNAHVQMRNTLLDWFDDLDKADAQQFVTE